MNELHPLISEGLEKARLRVKKYIQMGVIVKGDVASLGRLGLQQKKDLDEFQKKQKSAQQKAQALQRLEQKQKLLVGRDE